MNEAGAKTLAAAIVRQAFEDLDDLYNRVMMVRAGCRKSGGIYKYLLKRQMQVLQGKRVKRLPFDSQDDMTVVLFFRSRWGSTVMSGFDLAVDRLPREIEDKLTTVESYMQYCRHCVHRYKPAAAKNAKRKLAQ